MLLILFCVYHYSFNENNVKVSIYLFPYNITVMPSGLGIVSITAHYGLFPTIARIIVANTRNHIGK